MSSEASCDADQRAPTGQRRTFLEVLNQVIGEQHPGLRSGLVIRDGSMVIFVINSGTRRKVEVGCDFDANEGWSFTWAANGQVSGPVQDAEGVARTIAHHLQAETPVRP